jgi:hypothetical protein
VPQEDPPDRNRQGAFGLRRWQNPTTASKITAIVASAAVKLAQHKAKRL